MEHKKSILQTKSYDFSLRIVSLVKSFPENRMYWVFSNQLIRSGTSIGANIFEAQGSGTKKEFARFLSIALKSAKETDYWLCLLHDSKLISSKNYEEAIGDLNQIAKLLTASIKTIKAKIKS